MTRLTPAQIQQYNEDGYIVLKGMLSAEQIGLLGRTAREDRVLDQHSFGKADGEGGTVRLSLWNHPTDTVYGMIARSESIVGVAEIVTVPSEMIETAPAWAIRLAVLTVSPVTVSTPDGASMTIEVRLIAPSPELIVGTALVRLMTARSVVADPGKPEFRSQLPAVDQSLLVVPVQV